jgi:hypothetical protein
MEPSPGLQKLGLEKGLNVHRIAMLRGIAGLNGFPVPAPFLAPVLLFLHPALAAPAFGETIPRAMTLGIGRRKRR